MAGRGHPKTFNKEEFKDICLEYFDLIYQTQTSDEVIPEPPTFFGLYKFASSKKKCSYHTIRRCFDEYWADIKKEFEEMRADLLVRGSSMGRYNSTVTIFALKNWCKWTDKQEVYASTIDDETRNEVNSLVDKLRDYNETDEGESS